jgi:hypothetical protein
MNIWLLPEVVSIVRKKIESGLYDSYAQARSSSQRNWITRLSASVAVSRALESKSGWRENFARVESGNAVPRRHARASAARIALLDALMRSATISVRCAVRIPPICGDRSCW